MSTGDAHTTTPAIATATVDTVATAVIDVQMTDEPSASTRVSQPQQQESLTSLLPSHKPTSAEAAASSSSSAAAAAALGDKRNRAPKLGKATAEPTGMVPGRKGQYVNFSTSTGTSVGASARRGLLFYEKPEHTVWVGNERLTPSKPAFST